jgi:Zn-dependent peptidase ImmA (M78 family)/transcriptional regulator with XRE-family HTH domain
MKPGTPGFVGERLREAREARGFMQVSLAVAVDVTPPTIRQYEKGDQTPRPEVMDRIAAALQLPVSFFTRPVRREPGVIYWRSLASATKLNRLIAERRIGWVQDIFAYLRNHLDFTPLDLPDFNLPRDPLQISDEMIEVAARETRKAWKIGDGPIEHVCRLLESRGVVLAREDLQSATLDALSKWCPEERQAYCLVSSGKDSAPRCRFSALHEIGHQILHRNLDRYHLESKRLHALIENQAHRYAGAFALPAESFSSDVYSFSPDSFIRLKEKWKFSIQTMVKRCETLGLIREEASQRLWRRIASMGWRLHEPLDDDIPQEYPSMLADGIRFVISEHLQSKESVADSCALAPKDIEELTGLERGTLDGSYVPPSVTVMRPTMPGQSKVSSRGSVLSFARFRGRQPRP